MGRSAVGRGAAGCPQPVGVTGGGRDDPLLELRLVRSVPFGSAILMALFALCGFSAFLFMTTQYLQNVRGMSALTTGLCLLPVGALVVVVSPFAGRLVGARGPRMPLVRAGAGRRRIAPAHTGHPLPAVLAVYLLFGVFLSTVNPRAAALFEEVDRGTGLRA